MSAEAERWREVRAMAESAVTSLARIKAGDALAAALEAANDLIARMGPSEAAAIDRVEELEAENADLRGAVAVYQQAVEDFRADMEARDRRIAELEAGRYPHPDGDVTVLGPGVS